MSQRQQRSIEIGAGLCIGPYTANEVSERDSNERANTHSPDEVGSCIICRNLLIKKRYQKEAVDYMIARETEDLPPSMSLWRPDYPPGGSFWLVFPRQLTVFTLMSTVTSTP